MQNCSINRYFAAPVLTVLLFASSLNASAPKGQGQLTQEDEKAIRSTIEAYRTAWLANDAKGVLKTFRCNQVESAAKSSRLAFHFE
jgi:hypothetical protein